MNTPSDKSAPHKEKEQKEIDRPRLLVVNKETGEIYDHPTLLMVCRRGNEFALPRPDELIPLPDESELFYLPNRHAVGLSPETGETEVLEELACAAFVAPAHTLTAHPAYHAEKNAPMLPLFAYAAVGFWKNKFYISAQKVDTDPRQVFKFAHAEQIHAHAKKNIAHYPENRLMQHLMSKCALTYSCPAARNLALGRYEAPLPVSRQCNARCIGCISFQENSSKICTSPQNRMDFTPTAAEIAEVMLHHSKNESRKPIYSFGQGCEGEPLTEAPLIKEAIQLFRAKNGKGTININSNASIPSAVAELADAGLTSLRVSLNSALEEVYTRYYRPKSYTLNDVKESIRVARNKGLFVSLNLLYFPGITDTEPELEALQKLIGMNGVSFVQLRNLNIDPEYYLEIMQDVDLGPSMGLSNFKKRLRKTCPWLGFGYFNPYVGEKATLTAPVPDEWSLPDLSQHLE